LRFVASVGRSLQDGVYVLSFSFFWAAFSVGFLVLAAVGRLLLLGSFVAPEIIRVRSFY
jgi:hypothetical protein